MVYGPKADAYEKNKEKKKSKLKVIPSLFSSSSHWIKNYCFISELETF